MTFDLNDDGRRVTLAYEHEGRGIETTLDKADATPLLAAAWLRAMADAISRAGSGAAGRKRYCPADFTCRGVGTPEVFAHEGLKTGGAVS